MPPKLFSHAVFSGGITGSRTLGPGWPVLSKAMSSTQYPPEDDGERPGSNTIPNWRKCFQSAMPLIKFSGTRICRQLPSMPATTVLPLRSRPNGPFASGCLNSSFKASA